MNEIKELTFTLSYDYGYLKRFDNTYPYNRKEIEYTIDDLLEEIEALYAENEDKKNEIDSLKSEIDELNGRITEYEEMERENK